MPSAVRNVHDMLLRTARLQIAILIWKTYDRTDRADVNPLRIGSGRIKRNSVRPLQPRCERFHLLWLAFRGDSAKSLHVTWIALSDKKIAVRRRYDQPRIIQRARILLHAEAGKRFGPRVARACYHFRAIVGRLCSERLRQILHRNLANGAGFLEAIVRKRSIRGRCRGRCAAGRRVSDFHGRQWRIRTAQRFQICNDLPALVLTQARPRRHSIVWISLSYEPENCAVSRALCWPFGQRRDVAGSSARWPVARSTMSRE